MISRIQITGLLVALTVLGSPMAATAQEGPDVRELLSSAVAEYGAHHYSEAFALFRRAHEVSPTARTLRGMGMTLFELRRYVEAIQTLGAAVEATERPLTDRQRVHANGLMERAQLFVAQIHIEIAPPDAEIIIDDAQVTLNDGTLLLDPGEHRFVVRSDGYVEQSRVVRVTSGETREMEIALAREPSEPEPSEPEPLEPEPLEPEPLEPVPEAVRSSLPRVGQMTLMGVGAAMVVGGLFTAIAAGNAEQKLESECVGDVCPIELRGVRDEARRLSLTTDVLWAVGGASLLTGLIWLLVRRSPASTHSVAACSHEGCWITLEGAF